MAKNRNLLRRSRFSMPSWLDIRKAASVERSYLKDSPDEFNTFESLSHLSGEAFGLLSGDSFDREPIDVLEEIQKANLENERNLRPILTPERIEKRKARERERKERELTPEQQEQKRIREENKRIRDEAKAKRLEQERLQLKEQEKLRLENKRKRIEEKKNVRLEDVSSFLASMMMMMNKS